MASREKISKDISKMFEEQQQLNVLINLFVLGLFLVLVMYLYLI